MDNYNRICKAIDNLNYYKDTANILKSYKLDYQILTASNVATVVSISCKENPKFNWIGHSQCFDKSKYNKEIGIDVAIENAMAKSTESLLFANHFKI